MGLEPITDKITRIIILTTPFQKIVAENLFPNFFIKKNTLLLLGEYVHDVRAECNIHYISKYSFSKRQILTKPLKHFLITRKRIFGFKIEIDELLKKYSITEPISVYFGSDKDIFCQTLLNSLNKKRIIKSLVMFEEGVGVYAKNNLKDLALKQLYRIITPAIYGQRFYYIKRLGEYPGINKIFLRHPELIPKKRKGIVYSKFELRTEKHKKTNSKSKFVLLFSFPNQDLNLSNDRKALFLNEILKKVLNNNMKLYIKPHPREDTGFLMTHFKENQYVKILNEKESGETIEYFDYNKIINFNSSIAIDIISKNYPTKDLITFGFNKKPLLELNSKIKYYHIRNRSSVEKAKIF